MQAGLCNAGTARIQRHLVIYGGLSAADLPAVAQNAEIVILNHVAREHLLQLKQINPRLLLFQYHHAPGFHRHYRGWEQVDGNEEWFAHDQRSGERLVEKKYGWYLMNIASQPWRQYLASRIADTTDELFDGVFLDDVWSRFNNKFRCQASKSEARPPEEIVSGWTDHMRQMIAAVRRRYPKRIFINGAHEEYIRMVDGCMEENFVHPNWKPETDLPDPSTYRRMLRKLEIIKTTGKTLLVQSGTSGADPAAVRRIFEFCLASYHLIEGPNTSFSFQRAPTYRYLGPLFPEDVHPHIGEPTAPFRIVDTGAYPPNLAVNGNFEQGWRHWRVLQGRPRIETGMPAGQSAMAFSSRASGSDKIAGVFIPVAENTRYRLAAACKAKENRAVSRRYEKLGMQGRFFSADRKRLPGAYDLQFEEGTYDWLPFESAFVSPPGAAYFRLRIGFIGDGTGKGWVSQVYFGPASDTAVVAGRSFSRAEVLVNAGSAEATVTAAGAGNDNIQRRPLMPASAIIVPVESGAPDIAGPSQ
jgi:hypothetical protein